MENPSQYLLSPKKRKDYSYWLSEYGRQLSVLIAKYDFYSKYHNDILMQERLFSSNEELSSSAVKLIKPIEDLEKEIAFYGYAIKMDALAKAILKKSNKPFDGIDLKEITLIQQTLF